MVSAIPTAEKATETWGPEARKSILSSVIALRVGQRRADRARAGQGPGDDAPVATDVLRRLAEWLPLTSELSKALDGATDLEEIVVSIGRFAERTSGCTRALLYLGSPAKDDVETIEVSLPSGAVTRTGHVRPVDLALRVLEGADASSRGAEAVLPLDVGGRRIGALSVVGSGERKDLPVLVVAADHVARSIVVIRERVRSRTAEDKLRRLEEARVDFLTCVSHEIRTPLASVVGFSQVLDKRWETLTEDQRREFLQRIASGARTLHDLVDGSGLRRLDSLDPAATQLPVDLRALIVSVATAAGGNVEVDVPEGVWAAVDAGAFAALLGCLLPPGTEEPGSEVAVTARVNKGEIQLGVAGLAPGNRLKAGLARAREVAGQVGGRVWLELSPEIGRSVWFSLPQSDGVEVGRAKS